MARMSGGFGGSCVAFGEAMLQITSALRKADALADETCTGTLVVEANEATDSKVSEYVFLNEYTINGTALCCKENDTVVHDAVGTHLQEPASGFLKAGSSNRAKSSQISLCLHEKRSKSSQRRLVPKNH